MNCPKCNAELKPGARFCHVCGFDTQTVETTAPETIVNPNQNQNIMEQNTTPAPEQQPQNNQPQGFDFSKIPTQSKVVAGISLLGAISCFLPVYSVSLGFLGNYSVSMINAWEGVIILIGFLGIIALTLFGSMMKMDPQMIKNTPKYSVYAILGLLVVLVIQLTTNSVPLGGLGFGFYLALLSAAGVALVLHDVIKIK